MYSRLFLDVKRWIHFGAIELHSNQRSRGVNKSHWTRFKPKMSSVNCLSNALNHTVGDFDTFDIYRYQVAGDLWSSESELPRLRNESMEKLEVFVVPFTHVDPGWLKTFDSYSESTDSILDNMHQFMTNNRNMTFIWAEMVFFREMVVKTEC